MIDPQLINKVVLVTGANNPSGIGAATARAFAAQGARVFVTYFRQAPETFGMTEHEAATVQEPSEAFYNAQQRHSGGELVEQIRQQGGQAEAWEADLADPAVVPQLFDQAERAFGPVEVLVNNAAHGMPDTLLPSIVLKGDERAAGGLRMRPFSAQSHDDHFAVNSRATALLMGEFARRHIERGATWGRIINLSTDGASAFPTEISYGASKHAMESFSRAAAYEFGPWGVTVNIVSPGPIQTGYIPSEAEQQIEQNTPLRRVGQPEDVADVIVLLASEQARWLTGQLVYVGGGHQMPL